MWRAATFWSIRHPSPDEPSWWVGVDEGWIWRQLRTDYGDYWKKPDGSKWQDYGAGDKDPDRRD
jgi:hypothetical protein